MIGFAGARVIEQTIREKLPEGFQRAEYLLEHGMVDMVVPRTELAATLARLIDAAARQGSGRGGDASRRAANAAVDAIVERLHALHPRLIDLVARPARCACWSARPSASDALPPVIHVAGTNGKGSTCAFLRACWRRRAARPRLYLAASGALQRAHPPRRRADRRGPALLTLLEDASGQ